MSENISIAQSRDVLEENDTDTIREVEQSGKEVVNKGYDQFDDSELEFPDGGLRAWLVVFGAMCNAFSTFGYTNAWGIFQQHYQDTILKNSSPSTIAWIGSVQYSLIFMPNVVVGRMFDIGYFRIPFLLSSILLVVATFLVAECKEFWQFLLCQGFAVGIGCGMVFGPTIAITSHWFKRRRGVAYGWVQVGSAVGGTIFPIAAQKLIDRVGFQWTMRILGFILLVALTISNLTMKRRLPPVKVSGGLIQWSAFKSPAFSVYCASGFFTFLGLYTVLTYIDVAAQSEGISPNFAFYLVAIANASSGFGRLSSGVLADRIGGINIMAPLTALAGIITYFWPFATTEGPLIVIAILYGFCSGAYVSTFPTPLIELGGTADVGRRVGIGMTILAAGALAGPPISGAINTATGGYKAAGYYAGSVVILAVAMMMLCRHLVLHKFWGKF